MAAQNMIEVRKKVKTRKPLYKRIQSNQYAKFKKNKWRAPKGMGNKVRRGRKGHIGVLQVGYSSPKAVRGLNARGEVEIMIKTLADLDKVKEKNEVAMLSAGLGGRKRMLILEEAKKRKISISNVKDIDKAMAALSKEKKEEKKTKASEKKEEPKQAEAKPESKSGGNEK